MSPVPLGETNASIRRIGGQPGEPRELATV